MKNKLSPEKQAENARLNHRAFWIAFVIFLISVVIPTTAVIANLYQKFLENEPPTLTVIQAPSGLGIEKQKIIIDVGDRGAGLDEVIVRATARGVNRTIFQKRYDLLENSKSDHIEIEISGNSKDRNKNSIFPFTTGKIEVKVFDKSYWSNTTEASWDYLVDVTPPRVAAYTTQHNGTQGGVELVVYRAEDKNLSESGVRVRDIFFKGYPVADYGEEYSKAKNAYFAFYAIPLDFNPAKDVVRLYAKDKGNNYTEMRFKYNTRRVAKPKRDINVTATFLNKAEEIFQQNYVNEKQKFADAGISITDDTNLPISQKFDLLTFDYQKYLNTVLNKLSQNSLHTKNWDNAFTQPLGTITGVYGETKTFLHDGQTLGTLINNGFEFALPNGTDVYPQASGVVLYTGKMGIYGNVVIVDHGLGICTLYGYLSEILISPDGEMIDTKTVIGKSGNTGLTNSDRLYVAVLNQGYAVSPTEWWDRNWINNHIINKMADVKNDLGVSDTEAINYDWVIEREEEEHPDNLNYNTRVNVDEYQNQEYLDGSNNIDDTNNSDDSLIEDSNEDLIGNPEDNYLEEEVEENSF